MTTSIGVCSVSNANPVAVVGLPGPTFTVAIARFSAWSHSVTVRAVNRVPAGEGSDVSEGDAGAMLALLALLALLRSRSGFTLSPYTSMRMKSPWSGSHAK